MSVVFRFIFLYINLSFNIHFTFSHIWLEFFLLSVNFNLGVTNMFISRQSFSYRIFNKFCFTSFLTHKGLFSIRFHRKLMDERYLVKYTGYFLFKKLLENYKKLVNPLRRFYKKNKNLIVFMKQLNFPSRFLHPFC